MYVFLLENKLTEICVKNSQICHSIAIKDLQWVYSAKLIHGDSTSKSNCDTLEYIDDTKNF